MTGAVHSFDPDAYRVVPGSSVDLSARPTSDAGSISGKKQGRRVLRDLVDRMDRLQRVLWADGARKLLVVLQAMDAGGKDGTIRKVFGRLNPQGVTVTGFKVPTQEELAHDYLWRVHRHTPASGQIAVFNRSHYEDVLIVRVLGLVPQERWELRYDQINAFEHRLAAEGTTILKFFLHISRDEQLRRFRDRLDDPDKRWKFNVDDLAQRERWGEYMEAYRVVLERTSTAHAPWYVVPADRKWYRDLVVASAVVDALESMGLAYPESDPGLDGLEIH